MSAAPYRLLTFIYENGANPDDGSEPLIPFVEDLSFSRYEDGEIHFNFIDSSGAAVAIPEGGAFILTARRNILNDSLAPGLSLEATVTNAAGGDDCGYFPVGAGNTGEMDVWVYSYDAVYVDGDGNRWVVKPLSPFAIEAAIGVPDTDVTVPESQQPLGLGPPGISWRGLWDDSIAYETSDGVQYADLNGGDDDALSSFYATEISTPGTPPLDNLGALNDGWSYLAERGAQGAQGDPGDTGATGATGPTGPAGVPFGPETVTGNEVISAGALIKYSASVAGRFELWLVSGSPMLISGAAVTACSGAGASFTAQFPSPLTSLLSDGTGTIDVAAPVVTSDTVNGCVKQGLVTDPGFLGFNAGAAVAATLNAAVSVR